MTLSTSTLVSNFSENDGQNEKNVWKVTTDDREETEAPGLMDDIAGILNTCLHQPVEFRGFQQHSLREMSTVPPLDNDDGGLNVCIRPCCCNNLWSRVGSEFLGVFVQIKGRFFFSTGRSSSHGIVCILVIWNL